MAGLSAVIVSHNSAQWLPSCVSAVAKWADEIIVVDNASSDDSAQVARVAGATKVFANPKNLGFAGGANQGISASRSEVVLLLNPDAEVIEGIDLLRQAALGALYGAAAGVLTDNTGDPQAGFSVRRFPTPTALAFEVLGINRLWPGNPSNRAYRCSDLDFGVARDVAQPAGAFLAIRRSAWAAIGGFDEAFHPVWFEDVDFCLRLHEAGWRIRLVPEAKARHHGAHSVGQMSWADRQVQWYVSLLEYAAKHFGTGGRVCVATAVGLSSVPRAVFGMMRRHSVTPLRVCRELIGLSFRFTVGGAGKGKAGVGLAGAGGNR